MLNNMVRGGLDLVELIVEKIKEEIERSEIKLLIVSQTRLRRILNRGQRPAEGVNSR